jgi:hypothetical protein
MWVAHYAPSYHFKRLALNWGVCVQIGNYPAQVAVDLKLAILIVFFLYENKPIQFGPLYRRIQPLSLANRKFQQYLIADRFESVCDSTIIKVPNPKSFL